MIISRVQVLNYGCLRYVDVPLDRFHVFIGPNASGKSTLMDAIQFVSDMVRDGVEAACRSRTANFADLVWGRPSNLEDQRFEIALEFALPEEVRSKMPESRPYAIFRYEMAVAPNAENGRIELAAERGVLLQESAYQPRILTTFPDPMAPVDTLLQTRERGQRTVFRMNEGGRSRFSSETAKSAGSVNWKPGIAWSADRSAMLVLPDRHKDFPATTFVADFLRQKVVTMSLNSRQLRQASPPGMGTDLRPDGANIPWVADALLGQDRHRFDWWMRHMRCTFPGFKSLKVIDREDDRHKYLMVNYENGLEVPSWKMSDGALRFITLTVLAYLPGATGTYLIEEPENGIHPGALEELFNSLSSVYDAQVLIATHSPAFVANSRISHLTIFGRSAGGEVDISPGEMHPELKDWKYNIDLGTFFAMGTLA